MIPETEPIDDLLQRVGARVRALRHRRELSRKALAERAGLSERFLAVVEGGRGNASLRSLAEIARALGTTLVALVEPSRRTVALLGLRGAGKSTVGTAVAKRLGRPFVELDVCIEHAAGLSLAEIWELHGEAYYRRLERETLGQVLEATPPAIVATGGGIVADPETWDRLRRSALTIWLTALPEVHWDRVIAQGDHRPMANDPLAMDRLRQLLRERDHLYRQARHVVDTSRRGVEAVADEVERIVRAT